MNFDLGASVLDHAGDGQIYHSGTLGAAAFHNCTFEAARQTLVSYGYKAPEDNVLRAMVDPGSITGEPWSVSQAAVRKLAADLATAVEWPADPAAAIRQYGALGYVVHVAFWCDTNAWVPAIGPVVGSHAAIAIAAGAAGIRFKNPWPHPDYTLTDAQVRSLYDRDGILVFKRDVTRMGLDPNDPIVKEIREAVRMPLPPKPASLATLSDSQISTAIATMSWDAIKAKYGAEGMAYMYASYHPEARPTIAQAIANLKVNGAPVTVDLSGVLAAEAAIKAELDQVQGDVAAVKTKVDKDLA